MTIRGGPDYRTTRELVDLLLGRKVSAVELFERAVAHIKTADTRINAVIVRDFERAQEQAKAADAALARGERQPLLGVPMTVKEAYNVVGLPTTWGFPASKDFRPPEDALAITRVKAAGAVILGKTNVPVGLADWQSYNDIYGTTNNPWDLARTPGGSSGGSAASLAAGYVSLELGSDLGGSLRTPAHYCGVYAHKPSLGLVPARGHTPPNVPALPVEGDLAVIGPMARSAGDLALAMDILAGPDDLTNAIAFRVDLPAPRHETLAEFRILILDTHPLIPTAASVRAALQRLAERLIKTGSKVGYGSPLVPDLAEAGRTYVKLMRSLVTAFSPIEEYQRFEAAAKLLSPNDNSLAAWRVRGAVLSHRDWVAADAARGLLRRQWRELFRQWDLVLCPPMPTPAFPHDHNPSYFQRQIDIDSVRYPYPDQIVWPSVATVAGLPATVAPIDRSEEGLPIGVQIIGPYLEDRSTIRFAELIEREFEGFVPPPNFGS